MTYQIEDRNSLNTTWIKVCYSNRLHVCNYHRNTCVAKRSTNAEQYYHLSVFLPVNIYCVGSIRYLKYYMYASANLISLLCGCLSSSKASLIEKCKCSVFRGIRISFELLKTVGAKHLPHIIWTKGAYYL